MARSRKIQSRSRKSTKKCSRGRVAVKSHRHGSRTVPALCRKKSKSRSRSRSKSRSSVKRSGARKVTIHKKDGTVVTFMSRGRRRKTSRPKTAYQKFVSKFSKQHPEIPGGPKLIKAAAKAWGSRK
jgi:hypothetical protein